MDDITLREFFETQMKNQRENTNMRFDALDKALQLSRDEMNRRLEGLNQLRNEVITDRGAFIQREICNQQHKELGTWKEAVTKKLTVLETRSITWTAAVGVFFLIISIMMRWFGK
jgi:hypothetical protein